MIADAENRNCPKLHSYLSGYGISYLQAISLQLNGNTSEKPDCTTLGSLSPHGGAIRTLLQVLNQLSNSWHI